MPRARRQTSQDETCDRAPCGSTHTPVGPGARRLNRGLLVLDQQPAAGAGAIARGAIGAVGCGAFACRLGTVAEHHDIAGWTAGVHLADGHGGPAGISLHALDGSAARRRSRLAPGRPSRSQDPLSPDSDLRHRSTASSRPARYRRHCSASRRPPWRPPFGVAHAPDYPTAPLQGRYRPGRGGVAAANRPIGDEAIGRCPWRCETAWFASG